MTENLIFPIVLSSGRFSFENYAFSLFTPSPHGRGTWLSESSISSEMTALEYLSSRWSLTITQLSSVVPKDKLHKLHKYRQGHWQTARTGIAEYLGEGASKILVGGQAIANRLLPNKRNKFVGFNDFQWNSSSNQDFVLLDTISSTEERPSS